MRNTFKSLQSFFIVLGLSASQVHLWLAAALLNHKSLPCCVIIIIRTVQVENRANLIKRSCLLPAHGATTRRVYLWVILKRQDDTFRPPWGRHNRKSVLVKRSCVWSESSATRVTCLIGSDDNITGEANFVHFAIICLPYSGCKEVSSAAADSCFLSIPTKDWIKVLFV